MTLHSNIGAGVTAVDLFAGLGGSSHGMRSIGVDVRVAANHWRFAVDTHALNHPETEHVCQDLEQADFATWPKVDLAFAGPSCQGHSPAGQVGRKSSKSVRVTHDKLRGSAWSVVSFAEVQRPRWLVIENVPAFQNWVLFRVWISALQALGYTLSFNFLTASRWGVPQRRKRLFVIGTLDATAIQVTDPDVPEPAFGPCIDWDAGDWRELSKLRHEGPKRRAARARAKGLGDRFILQNVSDHSGLSLDEPLRTITTGDQWAVVDGDYYRTLTIRENLRGQGFSDDFQIPAGARRGDVIRAAGNAVPPPLSAGVVSAVIRSAA